MPVCSSASMRPAQKAPENRGISTSGRTRSLRFNEAGAKSAGKQSYKQFGNAVVPPLQ